MGSVAVTGDGIYQGGELQLFRNALNWKTWVARTLRGTLAGHVVEVGAGLGSTTKVLCAEDAADWLCLEPDPAMAAGLERLVAEGDLPRPCRVRRGTVSDLGETDQFDAALYMDVLEHIEDDVAELERIARHVRPAGRIVVLSPAHPWLFSPFDAAIGHFRRYRAADGKRLTPAGWTLERADYLDSAGLLLSLANKLLLRSAMPTLSQVLFWDRAVVPVSRVLDPLFGWRLGKSILFVWRRA